MIYHLVMHTVVAMSIDSSNPHHLMMKLIIMYINLFVIFCDDIFIYARQLHGELISVKLLTLSLYHVYIFTYTSVNISLHVHSLLGT